MPQPAVLHVIGGNDRGRAYELVLPETRIGRGADQDLVLADIAVSRRHITIHAEGGRYRLRDLGSGNGTLLNGARVDSVLLSDGDQVELGNTLMRFDHAPSRSKLPALAGPPPAAPPYPQSPSSYAPPAGPPPAAAAYAPPPSSTYAAPSPYDSVAEARRLRAPGQLPAALAPLGAPHNRLIAFGVLGLLSLTSLIAIVVKSIVVKPALVQSDAEALYRHGLKLFAAKDYEGAKVSFTDALTAAPDSDDVKRYIIACDTEVHARGAMQAGERAAATHRYAEAVKAFDAVDSDSLMHDDAVKRHRELAPKAAADDLDEARGLQNEDPDTAKARLAQALALDPANPEARALAVKLHVELPPLPVTAPTTTPVATPLEMPPAPAVKAAPPAKEAAPPKRAKRDDDEVAPPKPAKPKPEAAKTEAPASPQALAAYKARDFAGAERLYRLEARSQPLKQMEKTVAYANQVRDLKAAVERAAAAEAKSPAAAVKDYEEALALDGKLGKGMHAAYFRQRLGKLQLPLAQQAFAQGRYEAAFAGLQAAQKAGAGDGGLGKQLEAKAKELTDKGVAVQKTQPAQAKTYWRQVIKMVPPASPTYVRAYQLLNQAGAGRKDADEE